MVQMLEIKRRLSAFSCSSEVMFHINIVETTLKITDSERESYNIMNTYIKEVSLSFMLKKYIHFLSMRLYTTYKSLPKMLPVLVIKFGLEMYS